MITPLDVLLGGLLPALTAATTWALLWTVTKSARLAWIGGFSASYLVGHIALGAVPAGIAESVASTFKPHVARDWLPLLVVLSLVPEAVDSPERWSRLSAWVLRFALCAFLPWRLLAGSSYLPKRDSSSLGFDTGAWSSSTAVAWVGGIAGLLLVSWIAGYLQTGDKQPLGKLRSLLATLVALGSAITLALSGSIVYGQLAGLVAACLAGCGIASGLRVELGPEAAAGPLVTAFGGTLVLAHFFSDLRLSGAVLLLISATTAIGWLMPAQRISFRWQAALRCAACLLPLTIAIAMAASDYSATQAEAQTNPYLNFQP